MKISRNLFSTQQHNQSSTFSALCQHIQHWQHLTKLIQAYLPKQGQWQVVCYQAGQLTLTGDNQALVSQVRYLSTQYIQQLKQLSAFADLQRLHVVIAPPKKTAVLAKKNPNPLPPESKQHILSAARLVKNAKLSQALYHLASANFPPSPDK